MSIRNVLFGAFCPKPTVNMPKYWHSETEGHFRAHFIVNIPAVVQLNLGNFRLKIRAFQPCNLILRFARILRQIARIFIRKVPETEGAGAPPSPPGSYAEASSPPK